MTLKELYEANIDVKESQIPKEWKESFDKNLETINFAPP